LNIVTPVNLIEADFVAAAVAELRRARAGMARHLRRLRQRAAFLRYAVIQVTRKPWSPSLGDISTPLTNKPVSGSRKMS
jgi:hypothetical protein